MSLQKMITADKLKENKYIKSIPKQMFKGFSDYVICAFTMPVSSAALKLRRVSSQFKHIPSTGTHLELPFR